jgi:hypothetical protein
VKSSFRTLAAALIGAGAVTGCTALLGSFEVGGSDPGLPDGQIPSGDGATPGDGSAVDAGADAAPVVCKAPEVACNNVCTKLGSSSDHCGKCGRSCGGGACNAGVCKPFKLYDGALAVGPVAVGDAALFFSTSDNGIDNKLLTCPKSGCVGAPKQVALMQYAVRTIAVPQKGTVVFESAPAQATQRPALYACASTGCPSPPVSFTSDGLGGFEGLTVFGDRVFYLAQNFGLSWSTCQPNGGGCSAANRLGPNTRGTHAYSADATKLYFVDRVDKGSALASCDQQDTACAPVELVPGDNADVPVTATLNGRLFWLKPGLAGNNNGRLISCEIPTCTTPKPGAVGLDFPRELLVDASGVYWLTLGNKLQRCAPNNCLGGPTDFAGPLDVPHSIVADEAFVYWAEKTSVWRLAK